MKKPGGLEMLASSCLFNLLFLRLNIFWGGILAGQDIKKSSNEEVVENYCNKGHTYVDTDGNFTVTKID